MTSCKFLDWNSPENMIWRGSIIKNRIQHIYSLQRLLKELGDNSSRAPYFTDYYVGNSRSVEITPLKAEVLTHCWEPTPEVTTLSTS